MLYISGQFAWLAQLRLAEFPGPPDMAQVGNGPPRIRSRSTSRTGGTHAGMALQLPARHRSTVQPSAAIEVLGDNSADSISSNPAMKRLMKSSDQVVKTTRGHRMPCSNIRQKEDLYSVNQNHKYLTNYLQGIS